MLVSPELNPSQALPVFSGVVLYVLEWAMFMIKYIGSSLVIFSGLDCALAALTVVRECTCWNLKDWRPFKHPVSVSAVVSDHSIEYVMKIVYAARWMGQLAKTASPSNNEEFRLALEPELELVDDSSAPL